MDLKPFPAAVGRLTLASAPEGVDAFAVVRLARERGRVLHVARDDARMATLARSIGFVDPALPVVLFPAWDCLPYDRVSPNGEIVSRRVETLAALADLPDAAAPGVVLTTVNAILQRVPPRSFFEGASLTLKVGQDMPLGDLLSMFARSGYGRTDTVREPGEYAVRGGIVDVFPTGMEEPVRLDFFGDELEAVRRFDAMTQRSTGALDRVVFRPVGEALLDEAAVQRFRSGYRAHFGAEVSSDPVYEAVSAGQRYAGMEHWLPLFHDGMATLPDYLGEVAVTLDHQVDEVATARFDQIAEYHDARRQMTRSGGAEAGGIYRPLPADALYLSPDEWSAMLADRPVGVMTPFAAPP
ncbi:MAG TPA: transcription-repair coupling factor, partial [Thalassobaculum sp.]